MTKVTIAHLQLHEKKSSRCFQEEVQEVYISRSKSIWYSQSLLVKHVSNVLAFEIFFRKSSKKYCNNHLICTWYTVQDKTSRPNEDSLNYHHILAWCFGKSLFLWEYFCDNWVAKSFRTCMYSKIYWVLKT